MSHRFKLEVVKVECLNEQLREVGKDEMRLIGFAIARKGHFFKTGFRSLGSYGSGDVKSDGAFPMVLVESELEDDGLEVLFCVWLVEEDGGGVGKRAATLGLEFRDRLRIQIDQLGTLGFPRDCIPFTAFYKVALPFHLILEEAGTEGRNDHVYDPFEVILDKPSGSLGLFGVSKTFAFQRSKHLGHYEVTLRFRYEPVQEILG